MASSGPITIVELTSSNLVSTTVNLDSRRTHLVVALVMLLMKVILCSKLMRLLIMETCKREEKYKRKGRKYHGILPSGRVYLTSFAKPILWLAGSCPNLIFHIIVLLIWRTETQDSRAASA